MARRTAVILAVVVLAGCTWGQPGSDGGNSADNRTETTITPQTVAGLHEQWKAPAGSSSFPTPIVGGGYLLTTTGSALVATAATGCPGTGVPTCAPAWQVNGSFGPPVSDGVSVFVRDRATEQLRVFDTHGAPLWTFTPAPVPNRTSTLYSEIKLDAGRVWVEVEDVDPSSSRTDWLMSLPAEGCGASSCNAVTTISLGPNNDGVFAGDGASYGAIAAADGLVFHNRSETDHRYLQAFDAATGVEQWRSNVQTVGGLHARDGWVVVAGISGGRSFPELVFATHPVSGCAGVPLVCPRFASFAGGSLAWLTMTNRHLLTINGDGDLSGFANDLTTGCTAAHECSPVWTAGSALIGPGSGPVAAAGGVVYAAKQTGLGAQETRIAAFSDDGSVGCTTTTTTRCTALWTATLAARAQALAVAAGHLYITEADGFVHVYGL